MQIDNRTNLEIKYWGGLLSKLVGATVIKPAVDRSEPFEDDPQFGLVLKLPNGEEHAIWFLSDEEGNSSGRFDICPPIG